MKSIARSMQVLLEKQATRDRQEKISEHMIRLKLSEIFFVYLCRISCEINQKQCYTLLLADNDGDVVVQNGCHAPE